MYLKDAMNEYAFDCRIRKLSPRTLDNYTKQLRYFEEYLLKNYGIDHIEEVKRMHIKHFILQELERLVLISMVKMILVEQLDKDM